MFDPSDYSSPWADYRARRRLFLGVWLGGLPVMFVSGRLISGCAALLLVPVWIAGSVFTAVHLASFPCPRCGQRFSGSWRISNPFAQKCVHCGLPKWSETLSEPVAEAER